MRMHSIDLLMRSMPLLLTSGGRHQSIAFFASLLIPWHGHGNSGEEERSYNICVNLFGQNMITRALYEGLKVVDIVFEELKGELPKIIFVVRLNGLLHIDDNCAVKEIARQLCMEHTLLFSKTASFDDNSRYMIDMLRECGLAHKMIIFVLEEFDLFTQGKQRLLYSLLDAMQTLTSQSVVIGISCRLAAATPDLMLAYIDFFLGVLDSAVQWWKDAMTGDDKLRVIMPEAASFKLNHGHEREVFDLYKELVNNNHGDTEALVGAETF